MSHAQAGVLLLVAAAGLFYAWLHGLGKTVTANTLAAASGNPAPAGALPKFP